MALEVVELDDAVHARLFHGYVAVALAVPLDVEAGLLLLHRRVVDEDSHVVRLAAVADGEDDVDLRGLEVDEDVVFVVFGDTRVAEVLQLVDPRSLEVDELVVVFLVGVLVLDDSTGTMIVLLVEDVRRASELKRAVVAFHACVELAGQPFEGVLHKCVEVEVGVLDVAVFDGGHVFIELGEDLAYLVLRLDVFALAEVRVPEDSVLVYEVLGGP